MTRLLLRRRLAAGFAAAASSAASSQAAESSAWNEVVVALHAAQRLHDRALKAFNIAERRYFVLPKSRRREAKPSWYVEAERAEVAAGNTVEEAMLALVRQRATSRAGLSLKAQLLAAVYGLRPGRRKSDDEDIVACLIRSLLMDLDRNGAR